MQTWKAVEISERICKAQREIFRTQALLGRHEEFKKELKTLDSVTKDLMLVASTIQKNIAEL